MNMKEIRALSEKEMTEKLQEVHKELMKANAQVALGATPKNPGSLRVMKRTIARMLMEKAHPTQKQTAKTTKKEVSKTNV